MGPTSKGKGKEWRGARGEDRKGGERREERKWRGEEEGMEVERWRGWEGRRRERGGIKRGREYPQFFT